MLGGGGADDTDITGDRGCPKHRGIPACEGACVRVCVLSTCGTVPGETETPL